MEQEQIIPPVAKQELNIVPTNESSEEIISRILVWFLPIAILVAFFTGIASLNFFNFFHTSTQIEGIFFNLSCITLLLSVIYIPFVCIKKIIKTRPNDSNIGRIIGITIFGYILIILLSIIWIFIGKDINEKILLLMETGSINEPTTKMIKLDLVQ